MAEGKLQISANDAERIKEALLTVPADLVGAVDLAKNIVRAFCVIDASSVSRDDADRIKEALLAPAEISEAAGRASELLEAFAAIDAATRPMSGKTGAR